MATMMIALDFLESLGVTSAFERYPWRSEEHQEPFSFHEIQGGASGPTDPCIVYTRSHHAARIRTLASSPEGWDPIEIDVSESGEWTVMDGHHRLAAAYYIGRDGILAEVFGFLPEGV